MKRRHEIEAEYEALRRLEVDGLAELEQMGALLILQWVLFGDSEAPSERIKRLDAISRRDVAALHARISAGLAHERARENIV